MTPSERTNSRIFLFQKKKPLTGIATASCGNSAGEFFIEVSKEKAPYGDCNFISFPIGTSSKKSFQKKKPLTGIATSLRIFNTHLFKVFQKKKPLTGIATA